MATAIVSGNTFPAPIPSWTDGPNWQGQGNIDVHATMPEFDISSGDIMRVDFDCRRVTVDGLYLVQEGEWTGVRRFQRVPVPVSPTGIKIKLYDDTKWSDVTPEMLDTLQIIGRVLRVFRAEIVG